MTYIEESNNKKILEDLNNSVYGLESEKEELLTYLKVIELRNNNLKKILCFIGPKGVGKKTLIYAFSKSMNRKCFSIKIGINTDQIKNKSYGKSKVGEIAWKIIHLLNQNHNEKVIILLENIEYLYPTFQNKVLHNFEEVIAITHEHALNMKHISEPLNFKNILFVTTATDLSAISQDFLSELWMVYFSGYSDNQKIIIARDWIIPKIFKSMGIKKNTISDDLIYEIIRLYTNEIGLNQLFGIIDKMAKKLIYKSSLSIDNKIERITLDNLFKYIGEPLFEFRKARLYDEIGVISIIGRSNGHGVIADIEVLLINKNDTSTSLIITGNIDNIFHEMVLVTISYLLYNYKDFNIADNFDQKYKIHINILPAGILKSGVSAGLSVILVLISSLIKQAISCDLSAIGEVTLHGKVKKITGVYEKILGASRLGIKKILYPNENSYDIKRLPSEIKSNIELIGIDTIKEAYQHTFQG